MFANEETGIVGSIWQLKHSCKFLASKTLKSFYFFSVFLFPLSGFVTHSVSLSLAWNKVMLTSSGSKVGHLRWRGCKAISWAIGPGGTIKVEPLLFSKSQLAMSNLWMNELVLFKRIVKLLSKRSELVFQLVRISSSHKSLWTSKWQDNWVVVWISSQKIR